MPAITFKLFKQRNEEEKKVNDCLVFSKKWNLVGVNLESLHTEKQLKMLKKEFNLYNLSSTQSRLTCLIKHVGDLDITILNIKFYPDIDVEDEDELKNYINKKEIHNILSFIKKLKEEEHDIDSLNIILGKSYNEFSRSNILLSRDGQIETTIIKKIKIEFSELFSKQFMGILLGEWKANNETIC